jgi:hypothetical protein
MQKIIGRLYPEELSEKQISSIQTEIKAMLHLNSIEIIKVHEGHYEISTNDNYIVDFNVTTYLKKAQKISLVKYRTLTEDGTRDEVGGSILSYQEITCSKNLD